MSTRYKGSILSSTAATTSSTAAAGVWRQSDVAQLITTSWPVNDPSWSSVSMLIHGDGTNGAQNNTFIDSSSNAFTITRNGTATQGSVNPFGSVAPYTTTVDGGSAYFNGTTDYLAIPANAAFSYTTGDFTWECWIYPTAYGASGSSFFDFWSNVSGSYIIGQCQLFISAAGLLQFYYATSTTVGANIASASALTLNAWSHVAVVRSGSSTGNLKLYVNGALAATSAGAVTQNLGSTGAGSIGKQTSGTPYYYSGYISNVRIVKGTAVYTTTFTPPTAPLTAISGTSLLLNAINAGVVDNAMLNNVITVGTAQVSTNTSKFGTGSIFINGTGNYAVAPASTATTLSGDFTIEFWAFRNTVGVNTFLFCLGDSFTATGLEVYFSTTGTILTVYSANAPRITTSNTVAQNSWVNIAVVRSGTTVTLYLNGTSVGTPWTSSATFSGAAYIGAEFYNGALTGSFTGYIDELRITKSARYTANYTPATQAFPSQ
jgi:hypothetical protein